MSASGAKQFVLPPDVIQAPPPLTKEEEDALMRDASILELKASLRQARANAAAREAADRERVLAMDAALLSPIAAYREKKELWRQWGAAWDATLEVEELAQYHRDEQLERCMWIEDDERTDRLSVLHAEEEREWRALVALAAEKHRYLVECTAWVGDWEKEYADRWNAGRADAADVRERVFFDSNAEARRALREEAELQDLTARCRRFGF